MQQPYHLTGQRTQVDGLQQNRVLRNTYLPLALSMVPTVGGVDWRADALRLLCRQSACFFPAFPWHRFRLHVGD